MLCCDTHTDFLMYIYNSNIEVKRTPIVKLSQKQRKKLSAESSVKEVTIEPVAIQSPWAVINTPECSLADIMKVGSPPITR